MNASGWARGLMSKNMPVEKFFAHVMRSIESQLEEWEYDAKLDYFWGGFSKDMEVRCHLDGKVRVFGVNKDEIERLQQKSPFSVDVMIWGKLREIGIETKECQYINCVFPKR